MLQQGPAKSKTIEARFWPKVAKGDGCWEWRGTTSNGYGYMFVSTDTSQYQVNESAHRISWELHFGPIPVGLWVLHRCDNRPCVRPDHLFLGTNADNMADMARKGRHVSPNAQKTHCIHGHAFTPENTYSRSAGGRMCRECLRFRKHRDYWAKKARLSC
jgi:hypothetical protein